MLQRLAAVGNTRFWMHAMVLFSLVGTIAYILGFKFGVNAIQVLPGVLHGTNIIFPFVIVGCIYLLTSASQLFVFGGYIKLSDGINIKEWFVMVCFVLLTLMEFAINLHQPFVTDAYPSEYMLRIESVYSGFTPPEYKSQLVQRPVVDPQTGKWISAVTGKPLEVVNGTTSEKILTIGVWLPIQTIDGKFIPMTDLDKWIHWIVWVFFYLQSAVIGALISILPEMCFAEAFLIYSKHKETVAVPEQKVQTA